MSSSESGPHAHEQLVAGLVRLLASALPGDAPRVVQTHISTVILAGQTAYKLKKPVRLPFLDFSTLAQRRFFCDEELRINRRTAPQLYLDVLPVTGCVDAPVMGGPGEPIEWVLRMRRFDADGEFKALVAAGRLQAAQVDELALNLARFHQGLAPVNPVDTPGKDAWHWAADNLDEIAASPARPAACRAQEVADLRDRLEGLFSRLAPFIAQRQADGFVRECHGDLHLGNIVAWQGQVIAFDAIEFEPALRCIDVINDVAFTFMDLQAMGLPELAWRFINAWSERTGDYEGLVLLRAYASYRALVRAKVALLGGGAAAEFKGYWALAARLAQPPAPPRLVLTMGLSGSGKSTAALILATRLGALRVRSDVERKRLFGLPLTGPAQPGAPLDPPLYSQQTTQRTYARLLELARTLLAAGHSVVIDAAFLRQDEREAMRQVARTLGVPFALVPCVAPESILKQRIVSRAQAGADPSDATLDVLALQQRVREPVPDGWREWVHELVNDGSLGELEARAGALLAAWCAA